MQVNTENLLAKIEELENRLAESEQLIEAIKAGEVDAFAINSNDQSEVYTLQSGDYAYRVLIEKFGEGALNLTEEGLIVYTNTSFYELLNVPYEKVVGTFIFDLIADNSKEGFRNLFTEALRGSSKGEINLLINKKIIPVYVSLTSLQPTLATVGMIVSDLTEKKDSELTIAGYEEILEKANEELVSKNSELERSNSELASFSYIASHDLQEPLRKIQTFSDRILEKENTLTPVTKDYFQRIISASKRMQNLIVALLDYSRTNTTEIIYKPTDLNIILQEVKHNLREIVEECNAVIETSPLPTLNLVPHQMSQLFLNIIGNSLKYRKADVKPIVRISADIVPVSEIHVDATFLTDKYWKISVADNGIGFEQQYDERIFELFQRLHGKTEYEGTGIGLAICKKIIQNNRGFIKATGQPGIGATFNIYLPLNNVVK